jgi:hypothetical protein
VPAAGAEAGEGAGAGMTAARSALAALSALDGVAALTPVQFRHLMPTPVRTMQSAQIGLPHVPHTATRGRRRW